MSVLLMGRVFYCDMPPVMKLALLALADHAHDDGTMIHVGQVRLARKVGCSERTVRRVIDRLITDGWLSPLPRTGRHGPNSYRLIVERLPSIPTIDTLKHDRPAKLSGRPIAARPPAKSQKNHVRRPDNGENRNCRPDTAMSPEPSGACMSFLVERSDDALGHVYQQNPTNDALRTPSMAAFRRSSLVERSEDALKGRPLRSGTDTEGPPALSPLTDASSVANEAATATSRSTPAEQARGLLALVNTTGGTHFQPVEANLRLIRARLTEYGDWTLAAMVRRQWATWKAQPDMRPFFRPATLFNAEKCAQYVGQLTDTDRAWVQRKQAEGAAA